MSSIIKKIGTLRLDKNVDVEDVIHFGAPKHIRVSEQTGGRDFNSFELYIEDESKKPVKKEKPVKKDNKKEETNA